MTKNDKLNFLEEQKGKDNKENCGKEVEKGKEGAAYG